MRSQLVDRLVSVVARVLGNAACVVALAASACKSHDPPLASARAPARAAPAATAVAVTDEARARLRSLELRRPDIPRDVTNAFAEDRRAARFGQRLFFYPGFSGPLLNNDNDGGPESLGKRGEAGRVACAGCHVPKAGFLDDRSRGRQISLGSDWVLRRTPSLLDVGQRRLLTWVGKSDALFNQVFTVLESEREMNSSRLFVAEEVFRKFRSEYEAVFGPLPPLDDAARFPAMSAKQAGCDRAAPLARPVCRGRPGDRSLYDRMSAEDQRAVTRVVVNVGKALGAYVRQLSCGPSRFDAWLAGDRTALSASEQRGAVLFVGRARCVECHSGPYFSDLAFHNVGLRPANVAVAFIDTADRGAADGLRFSLESPLNSKSAFSDGDDGRLPQAVGDEMTGAFATPMLRCSSRRPSFMHTGQLRTLEEVVAFFNVGGDARGFPGKSEIAPLGLDSRERADLVAFLHTLDGPGPAPELLEPPPAAAIGTE
jgi:cytochrome c peroxidase